MAFEQAGTFIVPYLWHGTSFFFDPLKFWGPILTRIQSFENVLGFVGNGTDPHLTGYNDIYLL